MPRAVTPPSPELSEMDIQPIVALNRDIKQSVEEIPVDEIRYLVRTYYSIQEYRIESASQVRTLEKDDKPVRFLIWMRDNMDRFEDNIKAALDYYTTVEPTGMGAWAKGVYGIGPVISAGLLAYIDITKAPYVGHIERYAGLDPKSKWLGRAGAEKLVREMIPPRTVIDDALLAQVAVASQRSPKAFLKLRQANGTYKREELEKFLARRPWNNDLKVLCWKIGQSFMKFSGREECFYGRHYLERKMELFERNENGGFRDRSTQILEERRIKKEEVLAVLRTGKLTEPHINAMARRFAIKLFLSHWHAEAYQRHYGKPAPKPYPIAVLGHEGFIEPPKNEYAVVEGAD